MAIMINFTNEDINYIEKKINRKIKDEKDLKEMILMDINFVSNILKISEK